ncbi:hypothetical protein CQ052_21930 [Ochrobactrum sp. MYb15]|jgi:hypothetical protein|uniref:hypothetical protein n=1 Tax=Brucella pituitosa TaxID=571256 RepID=UPI000CFD44CC|nr:hypothetical protein CQZ90_21300 [Ochrobactrum sp. MYb19]PRA60763.1 hypothetical protein CQ053_20935 [Ochrobactrum sp. MYb18]PRA73500.1 hypothetical protein CQ049_20755 [Brucella thiophenivorans]PRA85116.1 hypothetical protein CQ051_21310 [Ochrobactrum sp. MYb14]PRA95022.1 hypothetical protein CQ052_21930 [Ochrobactrum sp. MYb15]
MTADFLNQLAFCLLNVAFQLESADEENAKSDFAVSVMEGIAASLQDLNESDKKYFNDAIQQFAAVETNTERKEFFRSFADNFGLNAVG